MNKKQMKKEQEKYRLERNQVFFDFNDKKTTKSIIWVSICTILFIALVFCGVNIAKGNWNLFNSENEIETEIDENLVICGTMFNTDDKEYLVLAYNFKDEQEVLYPMLIAKYNESEDEKIPLYYLNLDSGFNNNCVDKKANLVPSASKIKFSGPTLLHIKNNKIVKSYTSKDKIKDYFLK